MSERRGYFYRCTECGLRFPALESLTTCPSCGGRVHLRASRLLETDHFETPIRKLSPACVAVLENVRSAWNVGSMLRTGEAAGLAKFFLCGITPTPKHEKVAKTALGAERKVSWAYAPDALEQLLVLKRQGFKIWALETEGSVLWHPDVPIPEAPLALVVGNELCGVDPEILRCCDLVLRLPMRGGKCSLNVSVAFGVIALWLSAKKR